MLRSSNFRPSDWNLGGPRPETLAMGYDRPIDRWQRNSGTRGTVDRLKEALGFIYF